MDTKAVLHQAVEELIEATERESKRGNLLTSNRQEYELVAALLIDRLTEELYQQEILDLDEINQQAIEELYVAPAEATYQSASAEEVKARYTFN